LKDASGSATKRMFMVGLRFEIKKTCAKAHH